MKTANIRLLNAESRNSDKGEAMKKTFAAFLALFLVSILFGAQKIETVDGVRVVHNERGGKWGANPEVKLELIRTIGGLEAEENLSFNNPNDIVRDSAGNYYILDSGKNRIQKLDSEGKFIFAEARENQKPAWKGKVETENGVKVIKNPKSALYPASIFRLEEELSLGKAEGEEAYLFSRINGLDVDDDGNLYVLDYGSAQVWVFDDRGVFLRTIGRKGQGPGEMEMPVFVQVEPSGELFVFDYLRQNLITFSLDGKYLRQSRTRESFVPLRIDHQGNIVGSVGLAPPPIGGRELKKYFLTQDQPLVIAREDQDRNRQKAEMAVAKPALACDVSSQGNIVWGKSDAYELRILDPQGVPIRFIQKKHDPLPLSERDRKFYQDEYADWIRAGGKLVFPDHLPAFMDISVDVEERIFVKTYERVEGTTAGRYFDIFGSDGKYLAKVPIRANLDHGSVWKKNKLYAIETDSAGNPVVRRYGVHWEFKQ